MTAAHQYEECRCEKAGSQPEAILEVLIDRVEPQPGHKGHEERDDEQHLQWEPDDSHIKAQIVLEDPGGHAHIGYGGEIRGDYGNPGCPPRGVSRRDKISVQ